MQLLRPEVQPLYQAMGHRLSSKSPQVIRDLAGIKFDPDVVQAFFESISNL